MITHAPPRLIDHLRERFVFGPMPGAEAHFKMAHAVRRVDPNPDPASIREAAVLMPLFEKEPDDWHMIFIRRTSSHIKDKHAGQIGFPGGKKESTDPDLLYTALRETEEEIALNLIDVEVLGPLTPLYITVSKFMVHPYVAWCRSRPTLTPQESEVEEILEMPLARFADPEVIHSTRIQLQSGIVLNHVPAYRIDGYVIWGATAMILREFLDILPPQ